MQDIRFNKTEKIFNFFYLELMAASLFIGILFYMDARYKIALSLCAAAVVIFSKYRLYVLAITNIYFALFSSTFLNAGIGRKIASGFSIYLPNWSIRILIISLVFGTLYLYVKKTSDEAKAYTFFWLFLFLTGLLVFKEMEFLKNFTTFTFILSGYASVLATTSLYLILLAKQVNITKWDLLFVSPFWAGKTPIPGTYTDLIQSEVKGEEVYKTKIRGFKLIFIFSILFLLADILAKLFLAPYNLHQIWFVDRLPPLVTLPILYDTAAIKNFENLFLNAAVSCVRFTVFFIKNISLLGLQVGLLKILGFNVQENTIDVEKSRDLATFFSNTYRYYSRLVIDLCILPIFSLLKGITNFKLRMLLSIYLSIFLFGVFNEVYILQAVDLFVQPKMVLSSLPQFLIYYAIIGFVFVFSISVSEILTNLGVFSKKLSLVITFLYYIVLAIIVYNLMFKIFYQNELLKAPHHNNIKRYEG